MKGSWKLGNAFGIGIHLHWTFGLLVGYILLRSLGAGAGLFGALVSVAFVLAVFGCVILHELGHSLAARHYGIGTRHITLFPIGGVAALERMPRDPRQELVIAIAGPAVNVAIAAVLALLLFFTGGVFSTSALLNPAAGLMSSLLVVNLILVVFNLIPAFPMDGGGVLRAFLAMREGYLPATRKAARIGKVLAVLLGTVGFMVMQNPILIVIAVFVYFAAGAEMRMVAYQEEEAMRARAGVNWPPTDPSQGSFRVGNVVFRPKPTEEFRRERRVTGVRVTDV